MKENTVERIVEAKVSLAVSAPNLTPEQFELFFDKQDAVILIAFATGTSPERLNSVIKKKTEEGIPIFLVSDNKGDNHGILKTTYEVQNESQKAGAISLEKVNINNIEEITKEIKKQFALGKRGIELGNAVKNTFSYKEGEEKPVPEWQNPIEIKKQRELTKNTFKRLGLSDEEIEEELKKIGF